jgi:hypothetical protein
VHVTVVLELDYSANRVPENAPSTSK